MHHDSKPVAGSSDCILYQFVEDLPEENGVCELDCRKVQCTERDWIKCRRNLRRHSGEFLPDRELVGSSAISA